MKFSIIIPTANRNETLRKCLDRIYFGNQPMEKDAYEIIVTDDSKTGNAKSLIEKNYSLASWVAGAQRGPAANRNSGAKQAKGEWLIFLDDDVIPDSALLLNYQNAIEEHPNAKAFEGAILPDDWTKMKHEMAECPINTEGNNFWSANISIEKNLFEEVGGFDERFEIAAQEDQDIFLRLKEKTTIVFLPEAKVVHPVRVVAFRSLFRSYPSRLRNYLIFLNKHFSLLGYRDKKDFLWKKQVEFFSGLRNAIRRGRMIYAVYLTYTYLYTLPIFIFNFRPSAKT